MRIIRIVLLAGALIGGTSPEALAQYRKLPRQTIVPPRQRPRRIPASTNETPVPPNAILWTNLDTVVGGPAVDVDLDNSVRMRGQIESYDADGVTLNIDGRRETYPQARVERVSYYKSHVAGSVITGTIAGAATGFATGWAGDQWNDRSHLKGKYTLGGAVFGAVAGLVRGGYPEREIVYLKKKQ